MSPSPLTAPVSFHDEWGVMWIDGPDRRVKPCASEARAWQLHRKHEATTTVVYRVVGDWKPELDRWRTVPMCQICWQHEHPRRPRIDGPSDPTECYWCGQPTSAGIYVRARHVGRESA